MSPDPSLGRASFFKYKKILTVDSKGETVFVVLAGTEIGLSTVHYD